MLPAYDAWTKTSLTDGLTKERHRAVWHFAVA
jgi:hypothetical protein